MDLVETGDFLADGAGFEFLFELGDGWIFLERVRVVLTHEVFDFLLSSSVLHEVEA